MVTEERVLLSLHKSLFAEDTFFSEHSPEARGSPLALSENIRALWQSVQEQAARVQSLQRAQAGCSWLSRRIGKFQHRACWN